MPRPLRIRQATSKGWIEVCVGGLFDGTYTSSLTRRGRVIGGGLYLLDCYMGRTIRQDYSHAITTRTATDSNTFVMIVYEEETDPDKHNR